MLCYSTGSLPDGISFSEIAELLSPTPFKGVELVVTADMLMRALDSRHWEGVRDSFHARGLVFRNVHLGAPYLMGIEAHWPGLSSLDPASRERKADAVVKCMSIATALDSPHLTLTTGLTDSETDRAAQAEAFQGALASLVAQKPRALKILIEQEPEHVINSTAQLMRLGRSFPGEVYANFDVGHAEVVGEDIGASIRALGPLLRNIHLEDIKGRVHAHRLYGDGDVDFDAIFRSLRDIGYHGDYTPDLYPFKDVPGRALEASAAFLRKHGVLTKAL
jgi:sugar phosphate isomerase/epimerase